MTIHSPSTSIWTSRTGATAAYARYKDVLVVAGAPVCPPDSILATLSELELDAEKSGAKLMFFGVGSKLAHLYEERQDYCIISIGAQPVWDPRLWSSIVANKASLRAQLNRARNKGVTVSEWSIDRARNSDALRGVLSSWLATRGLPPLGFIAAPDLLNQLEGRRIFVAEMEVEMETRSNNTSKKIVGFLVASPIPLRNGWRIEQWPRSQSAPNGTTHLLVDAAMKEFALSDSSYVTLGLAPLSKRCEPLSSPQPAWLILLFSWVRAHARRFYNFEGLESFKASLHPVYWEPSSVIAYGSSFRPGMLRSIAGVFAAGSPGLFIMKGLASAVVEEYRRVRTFLKLV